MRWNCTDELADAWVHRPLAGLLVRRLASTRVTPDHLTLLSVGLGLGAALYLALGHPVAAPLLILHLVFDCADGQLARLRGPSRHGRWLDGVADNAVGIALFVGLWVAGVPLPLVAAAAASLFLRAAVFDGLKALVKGSADIPVYSRFQRWMVGKGAVGAESMRLAGLGGVTTHHVVLAVSALFGDYGVYLAYAVAVSNLLVAMILAARHVAASGRADEEAFVAGGGSR